MANEPNGNEGGADSSAPAEQTPDPITNLKAEFGRKLENATEEARATKQELAQIRQMLEARHASAAPSAPTQKLGDLVYSDPDKYAEIVAAQASQAADRAMAARQQAQNEKQQVLNQMVLDYPELARGDSEITKKAVELYERIPQNERDRPSSYRLAVREAAAELGLVPVSKRKSVDSNSDDFVTPGNKGTNVPSRRKGSDTQEIDPKSLELARLMGRPVDSPEYQKRLKKAAERKFTKYE